MTKPVPYVSQVTDTATRGMDCGLAAVMSLALWIDPTITATVDSLSREAGLRQFDQTQDGTTAADLRTALSHLGMTPVAGYSGYPRIQLVHYPKLPVRYDKTYAKDHWIVRLSDTAYHDPLWRGTAGANMVTTKAILDAAEVGDTSASRIGIAERPAEPPNGGGGQDDGGGRSIVYTTRVPFGRSVHISPRNRERAHAILDVAIDRGWQTLTFSADDAALPINGLTSRAISVWDTPDAEKPAWAAFFALPCYAAPEIPMTVVHEQAVGQTRPVVKLMASKTSGAPGDSITLTWTVTGGAVQKLELSGDDFKTLWGTYTAGGSTVVAPFISRTWKLRTTHVDGVVEVASVFVKIAAPITFTATPSSVVAGLPVQLFYDAQRVNGIWRAEGNENAATTDWRGAACPAGGARETVYPTATTTYWIKVAQYDGATDFRKVTVTVTSAPQPPPPVPVPGAGPLIGLNVLGGGPAADECIRLGAKTVQTTFNPGHGARLKATNAGVQVVVRPDMKGGYNMGYWMDKTELGSLPPGTIVLGLNENDCGVPPDSPKNIQDRAYFDGSAWEECKKRGLIYAGGGFAVASADMTNPAIVQGFRTAYAPLVNAGMWFNVHCYMARDGSGQNGQPGIPLRDRFSRTFPISMHGKSVTIRQSWWTAEWWRWFSLFCGFDPRRFKYVSDEIGVEGTVEMVDCPNSGGFRANPQVDMLWYLTEWRRVCRLPVLFGDDMKEYASNMEVAQVFCGNGGDKWAGYTVEPGSMTGLRGLALGGGLSQQAAAQIETALIARSRQHDIVPDALAQLWKGS